MGARGAGVREAAFPAPAVPLNFSLLPFPGEETVPGLRITGAVSLRGNALRLELVLEGPLAELAISAPAPVPARKERLWEETCLELFLARTGSEPYLEFNLSPAGHWNVYRFASYREGMREEEALRSLPFRVERSGNTLRLSLALDIGRLLPGGGEGGIEAGVGAVARTAGGGAGHWALAHHGPRPDFHRRSGFLLKNFSGEGTAGRAESSIR